MSRLPVVTGVSPKEGPPGTRVTIRGENLGNSPDDIIGKLPSFFANCLCTNDMFFKVLSYAILIACSLLSGYHGTKSLQDQAQERAKEI